MYGLAYGGLAPADAALAPIPVHAPKGCAQRLAGFFGRPDPGFLSGIIEFRDLADGDAVRYGGLRLTSRAVVHDTEAYGLRAECEGRVLAYSGDSGPCEGLVELARGADLFLCEADIDRHREGEGEGERVGEGEQVHLTPEDAGALARSAGVGELLVTHVGPTLTPQAATERAAAVFGGRTPRPVKATRRSSEAQRRSSEGQRQLLLSEALTKHERAPSFNASYFVRHI